MAVGLRLHVLLYECSRITKHHDALGSMLQAKQVRCCARFARPNRLCSCHSAVLKHGCETKLSNWFTNMKSRAIISGWLNSSLMFCAGQYALTPWNTTGKSRMLANTSRCVLFYIFKQRNIESNGLVLCLKLLHVASVCMCRPARSHHACQMS